MSGSIAVAVNADGRLELFALTKHHGRGVVAHKWHRVPGPTEPANWTGWQDRGNPDDSPDLKAIAVAANADGRLELFGLDLQGAVHSTSQISPNAGWDNWSTLAGKELRQIQVAKNSDGRLELIALGGDRVAYHRWQTGSKRGWGDWADLAGRDLEHLEVANNADGRLELFALGGDRAVYHRWQVAPGAGWDDWATLAGKELRQIQVAKNADGRLELFALGGDRAVYHRWQVSPNGGWGSWASLAGEDLQQVRVATNADGRLELFAVGGDFSVYHRWQVVPGGGWESWHSLGQIEIVPDITPVRSSDGRLGLIAYRFAPWGGLFFEHTWQITANGTWGDWSTLTEGPPWSDKPPPTPPTPTPTPPPPPTPMPAQGVEQIGFWNCHQSQLPVHVWVFEPMTGWKDEGSIASQATGSGCGPDWSPPGLVVSLESGRQYTVVAVDPAQCGGANNPLDQTCWRWWHSGQIVGDDNGTTERVTLR